MTKKEDTSLELDELVFNNLSVCFSITLDSQSHSFSLAICLDNSILSSFVFASKLFNVFCRWVFDH